LRGADLPARAPHLRLGGPRGLHGPAHRRAGPPRRRGPGARPAASARPGGQWRLGDRAAARPGNPSEPAGDCRRRRVAGYDEPSRPHGRADAGEERHEPGVGEIVWESLSERTRIMALENVSDTARWVAVYRAMESARPDALFHDPYAERLA